jgi:hypothetical protein
VTSAVVAQGDLQSLLQDPKLIGAIGLVVAAAAFVGIMTSRWLSPRAYAREFGMLAAFAFTAALAYAGVGPAGIIMYVMAGVLILIWIASSLLDI